MKKKPTNRNYKRTSNENSKTENRVLESATTTLLPLLMVVGRQRPRSEAVMNCKMVPWAITERKKQTGLF